jgi:hypothetical protein
MRLKTIVGNLTVLTAVVAAFGVAHGEDAPPWLATAAAQDVSRVDPKAPGVVILDDGVVSFSPEGVKTITSRWAIRILKREGRERANARQPYETETQKVTDFRAWLIRPDGRVKKYGKGETVDLSLVDDDVYNQARVKVITAEDEAEPNSVFGYEAIVEDRSVFTEFEWFFQGGRFPVLQSHYTVRTPSNWSTTAVVFNHPGLEPVRSGDSTSWEARDLPYLERQPMTPSLYNFLPRLAVNVVPAPGAAARASLKGFTSWNDVATYLYDLAETPSQTNDLIAARAAELVADASTELEKIQRIGQFAQAVKYVSIQLGLGRGGGYRPHAASEVLARSYGDCKDKANLMRALLKTININSFPVCAYATDRYYVRPEWPTPQQFNHAIIAIEVSDATSAPSVISHPELGRLLIFDPTDPYTPVGDIPLEEQGSLILVASKKTQFLTKLPVLTSENNRLERTVEAAVTPDANLTARVIERSYGQAAAQERGLYKSQKVAEYRKDIEHWVTSGVGGAQVSKVECRDDFNANRFDLEVELAASGYAQLMQGRLLVFRPALLSRRGAVAATEGERQHPIEIHPANFVETASVALPAGFAVDELPESVSLETEFGNYEGRFEAEGQTLKARRQLTLKPMILPASKYKEVKAFFDKISATEQAPAVLLRK